MSVPTFDVDVLPDHVIEAFCEAGLAQEDIENLSPTAVFIKWIEVLRDRGELAPHPATIWEVVTACKAGRMFGEPETFTRSDGTVLTWRLMDE